MEGKKNRRLSNPLIREHVVQKLSDSHGGMFLWVSLMLKELKSCVSVIDVQEAMNTLPDGISELYTKILQRLHRDLGRNPFELCKRILMWVVTALRPLSITELHTALAVHCQLEQSTLLPRDQVLLYSEREIELVCGSLVSIRDGRIQIVHLSVKEFLQRGQSTEGLARPYSELLVDPNKASHQLTLCCLRYISMSCREHGIYFVSGTRPSDRGINTASLRRLQHKFPFTRYAALSWLTHLVHCDIAASGDIARELRRTYESPCTFHWLEISLGIEQALLSLFLGLEELDDWVDDAITESENISIRDVYFLQSWCTVMLQIFQVYGLAIEMRLNAIHTLDLKNLFEAEGLRGMYETHGNCAEREVHSVLDGYVAPLESGRKAPKNRQLQKVLNIPTWRGVGFFIYDDSRDAFLSAELWTHGYESIYVQEATTGRRLAPATASEETPGSADIIGAAMSKDRKYLGIVQLESLSPNSPDTSDSLLWTSVWEIEKLLNFERKNRHRSWAKKVMTCRERKKGFNPYVSLDTIVFGDDGHFHSPVGRINHSTIFHQPLSSVVQEVGAIYYFSGDGSIVFRILGSTNIEKFSTLQDSPTTRLFLWTTEERVVFHGISQTGRYFALKLSSQGSIVILDTEHEKSIALCTRSSDDCVIFLRFSRDETRLFGFLENEPGVNLRLAIWEDLTSPPRILIEQSPSIGGPLGCRDFFVSSDESTAWVVTTTRKVVQFSLKGFHHISSEIVRPLSVLYSKVSLDATQFIVVNRGQKEVQVQFFNIKSAGESIRMFKLYKAPSSDPLHSIIQSSPDLRLLVVDLELFEVSNENEDLASKPIQIPLLTPLTRRDVTSVWKNVWCFSSCNKYIAYANIWNPGVGTSREWKPNENGHLFALFKINLGSRSIVQIHDPIPTDITPTWLEFHSSLPLMLLSYLDPSEIEIAFKSSELASLQPTVVILSLKNMQLRYIKYSELPKSMA